MTQRHTHEMDKDTTPAEEKTAQASLRYILYSFPGQNSRLYQEAFSVQRMCIIVIVQQKGVKFRPTAESVQSPYHKKGMFPYLQGTINLKAVSISLAEHPVCKQHISTFPIVAALTLQFILYSQHTITSNYCDEYIMNCNATKMNCDRWTKYMAFTTIIRMLGSMSDCIQVFLG